MWCEIGGLHLDQFACVPTVGSAGGIIIGWNSASLTGRTIKVGVCSLTVKFFSMKENLIWRCTTVYEPNERNLK